MKQGVRAESNIKRKSFSAIITRADGTVEDLGIVSYEHENEYLNHAYEHPEDLEAIKKLFESKVNRWIKINKAFLALKSKVSVIGIKLNSIKEHFKESFLTNKLIVSKIDYHRSLLSDLDALEKMVKYDPNSQAIHCESNIKDFQ